MEYTIKYKTAAEEALRALTQAEKESATVIVKKLRTNPGLGRAQQLGLGITHNNVKYTYHVFNNTVHVLKVERV